MPLKNDPTGNWVGRFFLRQMPVKPQKRYVSKTVAGFASNLGSLQNIAYSFLKGNGSAVFRGKVEGQIHSNLFSL